MNSLALVAEFFGTFLLLTSIFVTGNWLLIGLTLAVVILLIGNVSGAHVNPAVSFAMFIKGGLSGTELAFYSLAQVAGAAAAWYAYKAMA